MISTKRELDFYIMADSMMNRGYFRVPFKERLKRLIVPDIIMDYLVCMRKASYYSHQRGKLCRFISYYYKIKKARYGIKLGFSIGTDVFGYGLSIPHNGTIVVGGSNRIGNYAVLQTSICISDNGKIIGDGLYMGTGAKMTTKLRLGDGISVGANSVVNKSFDDNNCLLVGSPAIIKKHCPIWYQRDGVLYSERVMKIEELKKRLLSDI